MILPKVVIKPTIEANSASLPYSVAKTAVKVAAGMAICMIVDFIASPLTPTSAAIPKPTRGATINLATEATSA